jgi:hypothetical protein
MTIYHVLDSTTPWYEWLCYCEISYQLEVKDQPSLTRYLRYRKYLKSINII